MHEALSRNIPPAADRTYRLGKEVLVYLETKKQWLGPFEVVHVQETIITVQNKEISVGKTFDVHQVKPYFCNLQDNFQDFKFSNYACNYMNNITEIDQSHDSRYCSFKDVIQKEIDDLEKRKAWEIVPQSSISQTQTY